MNKWIVRAWWNYILLRKKMRILYVARDKNVPGQFCAGSMACLKLAEELDDTQLTVQDCNVLRRSQALPDWLNGTPILVEDVDGIPYRGSDAVRTLAQIVASHKASRNATASSEAKSYSLRPACSRVPPAEDAPFKNANNAARRPRTPETKAGKDDAPFGDEQEPSPFQTVLSSGTQELRNDKITESDVQKYMAQRNSALPTQPPM